METVKDIVAIIGVLSILGLWSVCLTAGIIAMWESFEDPIMRVIGRIKRLFGR
jgi:hypothetical protein